jgi:hypothetical protein
MRMICLVDHNSKSVVVYSLCKRFNKGKLLIEYEELPVKGESYLNHYDINMSWRRFKKVIQKKGFTFPNLRNGY